MENNLIKTNYNNEEVVFKVENGVSYVRINEVAKFCGWTNISKGKEYPNWSRVNKHLKTLGCAEVHNGDFIPEYIMYPLIGKANNERATKFMLWVGQVIAQLRQTGVVILDNATDEAIDFEKKYGIYRIRRTFTNSKDLRADYEQFKELSAKENKAKRLNGKQRVKMQEIIFDAIDKRYHNDMDCLKGSEMLAIQELLTDIKADTLILSNRTNGGLKAVQTKEIDRLKSELEAKEIEHNQVLKIYKPNNEDYIAIQEYPISKNSLYEPHINNDGTLGQHCTDKYRNWKYWFKRKADEAGLREAFKDVNFDEDVFISYKLVAPYGYDLSNLINPLQDILVDYFNCKDDQNFHICNTEIIGYFDDIRDGQIQLYLCNRGDR